MTIIPAIPQVLVYSYNLFIMIATHQWFNLAIPIFFLIGILSTIMTVVRMYSVMFKHDNDMSIVGKILVSMWVTANNDLSKFVHVKIGAKYILNIIHTIINKCMPPNARLVRQCFTSLHRPLPEACCWVDEYRDSKNIVVFFHPGGYLVGTPHQSFMADHMYLEINKRFHQPVDVLVIDYKKLPKHKFPTAIDETFYIYKLLTAHFPTKHFHFIGASAGGNLAINVIKKVIDATMAANALASINADVKPNITMPRSLVLWSPWIMTTESHPEVADTVSKPLIDTVIKAYYGENYLELSRLHGVLGFNYSRFPPTLVQYGEEYLEPEIVNFVNVFKKHNLNIEHRKCPGMTHCYHHLYYFSNTIAQDCNDSYDFLMYHFST